jgi:hypothetical protein
MAIEAVIHFIMMTPDISSPDIQIVMIYTDNHFVTHPGIKPP